MEHFHGCSQELLVNIKKRGNSATKTTHQNPATLGDSINIHFSCDTRIRIRAQVNQEYSEVLTETERPVTLKSIQITRKQHLDSENTYSAMKRNLSGFCWNISEECCERLTKNVLSSTRDMVESVSSRHNVLDVDVHIYLIHLHTYELSSGGLEAMIMQLSLTESESVPCMVPATDLSIKSLEAKIIDYDDGRCEICSICLEEFLVDCQAMCMPCSHVFHGDCIKKWLKTSHYCPTCRFEMPTS